MTRKKKLALFAAFLPLFTCCWFDGYHHQNTTMRLNIVGIHPRCTVAAVAVALGRGTIDR